MSEVLGKYTNGNVEVTIFNDGTKIRSYDQTNPVKLVHPESIDLKITNKCDMGCVFCHEKSTPIGKHADIETLIHIVNQLPPYVELAIGGGNPLEHPKLKSFLVYCKHKDIIANMTVNQNHLSEDVIELMDNNLIYGLGVSYANKNFSENINYSNYPNIVIHLIAGVHSVHDIKFLHETYGFNKFLILGFKQYGRGINYYDRYSDTVEKNLKEWYILINKYFKSPYVMTFDNLSIEQLNIRRFFTDTGWDSFYMGDEFTHSMYIDAVTGVYAPNSRSKDRVCMDKMSINEYFSFSKF